MPSALNLSRVPLHSFGGVLFADVRVGTPPQRVVLSVDTGSSESWLPSASCRAASCRLHARYDAGRSSTHARLDKTVSIRFGRGAVAGALTADTMRLADIHLTRQPFIDVVDADADAIAMHPFFGVLGLGIQVARSDGSRSTTLLPSLLGPQPDPVFALFVDRSQRGRSALHLGGVDPACRAEPHVWAPVRRARGWWAIDLLGVTVGDTPLAGCSPRAPCLGVVDSGTGVLTAPADAVAEMMSSFGADRCNPPSLHFDLGAGAGAPLRLTVAPIEYARQPRAACRRGATQPSGPRGLVEQLLPVGELSDYAIEPLDVLTSVSHDSNRSNEERSRGQPDRRRPVYILGSPLLSSYYTAFDLRRERVGFARARESCTSI